MQVGIVVAVTGAAMVSLMVGLDKQTAAITMALPFTLALSAMCYADASSSRTRVRGARER